MARRPPSKARTPDEGGSLEARGARRPHHELQEACRDQRDSIQRLQEERLQEGTSRGARRPHHELREACRDKHDSIHRLQEERLQEGSRDARGRVRGGHRSLRQSRQQEASRAAPLRCNVVPLEQRLQETPSVGSESGAKNRFDQRVFQMKVSVAVGRQADTAS